MQGLAGHRTDVVADVVDIVANEDGSLIDRQLGAGCILAPAAVVGQQAGQVVPVRIPRSMGPCMMAI